MVEELCTLTLTPLSHCQSDKGSAPPNPALTQGEKWKPVPESDQKQDRSWSFGKDDILLTEDFHRPLLNTILQRQKPQVPQTPACAAG